MEVPNIRQDLQTHADSEGRSQGFSIQHNRRDFFDFMAQSWALQRLIHSLHVARDHQFLWMRNLIALGASSLRQHLQGSVRGVSCPVQNERVE